MELQIVLSLWRGYTVYITPYDAEIRAASYENVILCPCALLPYISPFPTDHKNLNNSITTVTVCTTHFWVPGIWCQS
jgi:hypothetical protein